MNASRVGANDSDACDVELLLEGPFQPHGKDGVASEGDDEPAFFHANP